MDDTLSEYRCPWCSEWTPKTDFKNHQSRQHRNEPGIEIHPESIGDIEKRFIYLGYWEER